MKICVLVSYDEGYKRMASYTVRDNIRKYCDLHGYDLHIDYQEKFTNGKPSQWQKITIRFLNFFIKNRQIKSEC